MKLNELTTPFHKKTMYAYAPDGNTVVLRNVSVRNVNGAIYSGEPETTDYGEDRCKIYLCYDGYPTGLTLFGVSAEMPVQSLVEYIRNSSLDTATAFIENMRNKLANGSYIKDSEILMTIQIDPVLAVKIQEAKRIMLKNREELERKERKEQKARDKAYVDQKNEEAEEKLQSVISGIKAGGIVENKKVTFYTDRYSDKTYSSFNLLMRRYGIKVPLRTQGWINDKLGTVEIKKGKYVRATYHRVKNGRCSQVFFDYMDELISAIMIDNQND